MSELQRTSRAGAVLSPELLCLLVGDPAELADACKGLRAADVAEAVRDVAPRKVADVIAALPFDLAAHVLEDPALESRRYEIVRRMNQHAVGRLVEAMSPDMQADLLRELPHEERLRLLRRLDAHTRETLKRLLRYPADTAAGMMTTDFTSVPRDWTIERVLRYIGDEGRVKETMYAVYVLDPINHRLVHVVSLRELITAAREARVGDVGDRRAPITVRPTIDREEVSRIISKYNLLAVPVVDEQGHILGIVTVDDVLDAMVREQTEDVQKFGGMDALDERYTDISFIGMVKKRAGWLTALFIGEMLTATAMGHFEREIERAVVLALFVPLIISSGGNSGSQATSLIIRSMALRELGLRDWWRVALRELPAGLALGFILGTVGVARILLWELLGWYHYGPHWLLLATTVGIALVGVVTFGSLAGSMLPFVLRRLGFDPASASAPFVATLVDVTGLVIYFTVAAMILHGTLL